MPVELARAKVNLCLHVTGKRDDGMHLLDSFVVFPSIGDELEATSAEKLELSIEGPFSESLEVNANNLVIKASILLGGGAAKLKLTKNLPVASGIGGGSADAAAAIRLLSELWGVEVPSIKLLTELGADVPVCVNQAPTRMSGIGEVLEPLPTLPEFWIVLVNAGEPVATGPVFKAMETRDNARLSDLPPKFSSAEQLFVYLRAQRNDMQSAAVKISPIISDVLAAIQNTDDCALARMSGSGGTCFGLYATDSAAKSAANKIQRHYPDWWVVSAEV